MVTVQLSVTASSAEHNVTENSADEDKRKSGLLGLTAAADMGRGMSTHTSVFSGISSQFGHKCQLGVEEELVRIRRSKVTVTSQNPVVRAFTRRKCHKWLK